MLILTGCGGTGQRLDGKAAAQIGTINAGIAPVRQPAECGRDFPLLDRARIVGREKLVVIDTYEAYIDDTINPSRRRCFKFNETVNAGLAGKK